MPLRTRLRRAFTRGSQDESLSKTSSKASKAPVDPNVYQPGEKMPPLKYRRPVAPEHKEKLESFSWAKAWRRRSDGSQYSPMGSRMPSRKSSNNTLGRRSIGGRSMRSVGRKHSSRGNDGIGIDSGVGFDGTAGDGGRDQLKEDSDDEGDVLNVGLSRNPTQDPRKDPDYRRVDTATSDHLMPSAPTSPKLDQPFSSEELALALKKTNLSSLNATQEESDRSGDLSPETPASPGTAPQRRRREALVA